LIETYYLWWHEYKYAWCVVYLEAIHVFLFPSCWLYSLPTWCGLDSLWCRLAGWWRIIDVSFPRMALKLTRPLSHFLWSRAYYCSDYDCLDFIYVIRWCLMNLFWYMMYDFMLLRLISTVTWYYMMEFWFVFECWRVTSWNVLINCWIII
jgi:hypothetical protein